MQDNNIFDDFKNVLDNNNYKKWRMEHTKVFGELYADAFSQNDEAQVCLTAALINISQREFESAMPKLDMLENICTTESDEIAVNYFKGLNYEMLGNEAQMSEYYEKLRNVSAIPKFILTLHPYYRTAKFAQRESECSKSMYYYRKALDFYDGAKIDSHVANIASHIIYDMATLCLYMHEYTACERLLNTSYQYDKSQNQQRDYVKAVLLAVQGNRDDCKKFINSLNLFIRANCQAITDAIFSGSDPHYCIVTQDRSLYEDFWNYFLQDEESIRDMILGGKIEEAQRIVSQKLTKALGFMKRTLDCRIEKESENIEIYCKNYWVKSLIEEHTALFAAKPDKLSNWKFVSVKDFDNY